MIYGIQQEQKAVELAIKSALTPLSVIKSFIVLKNIKLLIKNILHKI